MYYQHSEQGKMLSGCTVLHNTRHFLATSATQYSYANAQNG